MPPLLIQQLLASSSSSASSRPTCCCHQAAQQQQPARATAAAAAAAGQQQRWQRKRRVVAAAATSAGVGGDDEQHQQHQQQQWRRRDALQLLAAASGAAAAAAGGLAPHAAAAASASMPAATPNGAAPPCALATAASGLRWCDLAPGDGPAAIRGAFTKAHYVARVGGAGGAVFDSTYARRQPLLLKAGARELIEAIDVALLGDGAGIPPMREGGRRLVVAPPGPLQKQGVKSLNWVVGMLDALEEAGEKLGEDGIPTTDLAFEVELLARRRK